MRLLVTGGLGFIGSNFIRRHLSRHKRDRIANLDVCTYAGNPANLEGMEGRDRCRWIRGDIAEPRTVDRCMRGVDAVVHFAAETHVDRSILDADAFLRTNVLGTRVLLDAALKHGVRRFLHVSTDEVYGSVARGKSKEGDPLEPNSPYAASKAASDLMARAYHRTYGLDVIVTRASNNFGPYQYPEKALPLMITNWLTGRPFPLYGDGLNVRDWLYVVDHVRALEILLRRGKAGEVYNIGGAFSMNNRELAARVRAIMGVGRDMVRRVTDRPGHDRRYAVDCAKLKRLGWRHSLPFNEALRRTVEWYGRSPDWWGPLKEARGFKRYYRKQYKSLGAR